MKSFLPKMAVSVLDFPVLTDIERILRKHLTQVWPTRHMPKCPPACAALVDTDSLSLLSLNSCQGPKTLLVYLPADFEPHLTALANESPAIRIHPDISLQQNGAYLAWSAPALPGKLPLTLWVELSAVVESLRMNKEMANLYVLPVVFFSGQSFVIRFLEPDTSVRKAYETALSQSQTPPQGFSDQERQKARTTAENYSERPWLFMRYEVKCGDRRHAVNWAPVCSISRGLPDDWEIDE